MHDHDATLPQANEQTSERAIDLYCHMHHLITRFSIFRGTPIYMQALSPML